MRSPFECTIAVRRFLLTVSYLASFLACWTPLKATPPSRGEAILLESGSIRLLLHPDGNGFSERVSFLQGKDWKVRFVSHPNLLFGSIDLQGALLEDDELEPLFSFEQDNEGWEILPGGDFPQLRTPSTRLDFNKAGKYFIGTTEDGSGWYNDAYTGEIHSPAFTLTRPYLDFLIGGGFHPHKCYLGLFDSRTGGLLAKQTGANDEFMVRKIWDTRQYAGREVFLKAVDYEKGGWGHINVDDIRLRSRISPHERLIPRMTGYERKGPRTVWVHGMLKGNPVCVRYSLDDRPDALRIVVHLRIREPMEIGRLTSAYKYVEADGVETIAWAPNIKRSKEEIIGDHAFRAPVLLFEGGGYSALIPDLDLLEACRPLPAALDMERSAAGGTDLAYGWIPYRIDGHVYYAPAPEKRKYFPAGSELVYGLYLKGGPKNGKGEVNRFLWLLYGRPRLCNSPDVQKKSFDEWCLEAWEKYGETVWLAFELDGKKLGTLRSLRNRWSNRQGTDDDAWFNAWFQTLRTAYGMFLYGNRSGKELYKERAVRILDLALSAPARDGAFPTIFYLEDGKGHWIPDNGWAGYRHCYHAFDMSWTAYWLLRWKEVLTPEREEILSFCRAYGNFLLKNQLGSGAIPSWYQGEPLKPLREALYDNSAETSGSALFLAKLYSMTGEEKYLNGALKGMRFMERDLIPQNKWFDFEAFLSCSKKAFDTFDPHTGQYPQNTLSMIQAAKAYALLSRIECLEDRESFIQKGERVLQHLALYQQVWSPPWLSPNLIGGFGVQNSDGEWSDARQCTCALLFLEYYRLTGNRELLERSVAALRSAFAVAPYENWAHSGEDRPGANTGIHWGTGSAAASVEICREELGDAFFDLEEGWGIGVNGCTAVVESLSPRNGERVATISLTSPFSWPRPMTLKFKAEENVSYRILVNGRDLGLHSGGALSGGLGFGGPFHD